MISFVSLSFLINVMVNENFGIKITVRIRIAMIMEIVSIYLVFYWFIEEVDR